MALIPCHNCHYAIDINSCYRCTNPCIPAHPPSCISDNLETVIRIGERGKNASLPARHVTGIECRLSAAGNPPAAGPAAQRRRGRMNSRSGGSVVTEHRHALQLGLGNRALARLLCTFGTLALQHSRLEHRHSGKRSCGHFGTLSGSIESQDSLLTAYSWLIHFPGSTPPVGRASPVRGN